MRRLLPYFFILLLGSHAAWAQPLPSAEGLLQRWTDAQEETLDRVNHVQAEESGTLVLDGPLGQQRLEYRTTLDGLPRSAQWARRLEWARLNDRVIPKRRMATFERRMRNQFKPIFQQSTRFIPSPTRLITLLRPRTQPVLDDLDGVQALRFEAVLKPVAAHINRQGRAEVERVTLWFSDTETPELLRVRILLRHRRNPAPTLLEATYTTLDGLAVPATVSMEGSIEQKRRLRTFTTLVTLNARYRY